MNLQQLIEQYVAYRKGLGELQGNNAGTLRRFGRFIGADADIGDVRVEQVDAFLTGTGPHTLNWHIKLSVLRPFYRYAISRGYAAAAPLPRVIPKKPPPFVPYIYTHEELRRLLDATSLLQRRAFRIEPLTMRTAVLLLYATGLRVSEMINLDQTDVDLDNQVITVRDTKFFKTRLVPFGSQLSPTLTRYARQHRTVSAAQPNSDAFFTTRAGRRLERRTVEESFQRLREHAGVRRSDGARYQPRLHDLRHSHAVHRLTQWYRQGADVQKLLPLLSVYLGHVYLQDTVVYLSMTPELLQEANKRFESYLWEEDSHV
jgi:site-specific recombinase XerD